MAKPVIADWSVVAFNISILLRFVGLDIFDPDALFLCPRDELVTDVFRAAVTSDRYRFATPLNELCQRQHSWSGMGVRTL